MSVGLSSLGKLLTAHLESIEEAQAVYGLIL